MTAYEAIEHFKAAGGAVEYAYAGQVAAGEAQDLSRHKEALRLGMAQLCAQEQHNIEKLLAEHRITRESASKMRTKYDLGLASPKRLTLPEFLGTRFDHGAGSLLIKGRRKDNLNRHFLAEMPEEREFERFPISGDPYICDGYAACFVDPPYSIHAPGELINTWFGIINEELFGGLHESLVIYEWLGDWTSYFNAGREWWGAFAWSVGDPITGKLAVILASTTD